MEFALLLPVLLAMIFGTTELGRAIYTYNALDKAVRDAARHLSQHETSNAAVQGQARCLAAYGNTSCSGPALAPGLTDGLVKICDAGTCPVVEVAGVGSIRLITVSIQGYAYDSVVEYVIPDLTFNNISVTMRGQL